MLNERAGKFGGSVSCAIAAFALFFSAVTFSEATEIVLPWIKQKTDTECGRAALASVAARRSGDVNLFYSALPSPLDRKKGYSLLEMQRYSSRVGVSLSILTPPGITFAGDCAARTDLDSYFQKLAQLIGAGHPIVVPTGRTTSAGHYLVLVDANEKSFRVLDPSRPGLKPISFDAMKSMMCGFGYVALAVD